MTNRLSEIKRKFFANRVANSTRMPMGQLMKDYFNSVLTSCPKTESIASLEARWLQEVIVANGGTISGDYSSELYKTACLTLGFRTFTRDSENEMEFYQRYQP